MDIKFDDFQSITQSSFNKNIALKIYDKSRKVYIVLQESVYGEIIKRGIYDYYPEQYKGVVNFTIEEKILEDNEIYVSDYHGRNSFSYSSKIVKLMDKQDGKRFCKILSRRDYFDMKIYKLNKELKLYNIERGRMQEMMGYMQQFGISDYNNTIKEIDEL